MTRLLDVLHATAATLCCACGAWMFANGDPWVAVTQLANGAANAWMLHASLAGRRRSRADAVRRRLLGQRLI